MNDKVQQREDGAFDFCSATYPTDPGVYLMKDETGRILYVGKAKNLRRRLCSYFQKSKGHTPKTKAMVAQVRRIDTLITTTEKEALLLEASLIKKHRPRYNIVLRDDKQYLLFRLIRKHPFPRLVITRNVVRDGSVYYGPFTSAVAARDTFKLLGKVFPLRKCSDHAFANRSRPCLYHDMGQCLGPCVNRVDPLEYAGLVQRVEQFLSGRAGELADALERGMNQAAREMRYEQAAALRDQLRAVRATVEKQSVVAPGAGDRDVVALAEVEGGLGLGHLFVRRGMLLDEKTHFWPGVGLDDGDEVLESFVSQFYTPSRFIPPRILLPRLPETGALAEALSDRRGAEVVLAGPSGAEDKRLLSLARSVAARAREQGGMADVLAALARRFGLPQPPRRMECVDVSHLGGTGMRAGMTVFEDGKHLPEGSRLYAFDDLEGSGDDYAALAAWAARRAVSDMPWPDLILVDGGQGQLAAVQNALDAAGAPPAALAAIAKGPSRRAGELEDRVFVPGRKNHLPLKPGSPELLLLQHMRDSAHRFVIGRQRRARKTAMLHSELTGLPGIGPKTARLLWDAFGSLDAMIAADENELARVPGIGKRTARTIRQGLASLRPGDAAKKKAKR